MSRRRDIGFDNKRITQKFEGLAASGVPVNFQSDWKRLQPDIATSSLHEILLEDFRLLSE